MQPSRSVKYNISAYNENIETIMHYITHLFVNIVKYWRTFFSCFGVGGTKSRNNTKIDICRV